MSLVASLQALSTTGAFASRAFLPLLLVGLIARWPQLVNWIPFVPDRPIVLSERLAWIASPWCLAVVGALALLESLAERDTDARRIFQEVDAPLKGMAAFVTAFAIVDAETGALLRHVAGIPVLGAGPGLADPGTLLAIGFALAVGGITFALAAWRSLVFREARDVADDFGLGRPVAWIEELWSAGSLLLAIVAPVLAIIVALVGLGLLRVGQLAWERAENRGRMPCQACGVGILPPAAACPSCGASREPLASGAGIPWPDRWFGRGGDRGLELLGRGRCPACAEIRDAGEMLAHVPHGCGWPDRHAAERQWSRDLLLGVRARVVPLAVFAGLLGIVPVAGTVAALLLARCRIGAPLRRYLPPAGRVRARWTVRLLAIPLILASGIPGISALCAAGLVVLSGMAWTSAFERARASHDLVGSEVQPESAGA